MGSNGGFIGAKRTPSIASSSGIWSISQQQRERGAFNWPGSTDASGGFAAPTLVNIGGTNYKYLEFRSSGDLTVIAPGEFTFYLVGGGASGFAGNGYNAFGLGGSGGGITQSATTLAVGTYAIVVGGGGAFASTYARTNGSASTGGGFTGAGASTSTSGGTNANGAAGTQVNTFIGGSSLFKAAGGGNANSGAGGSGIGGNAAGYATAGTAAANTGSGGGGAGGSGQPNLLPGTAGAGGSGIVYVRWVA